MKVLVENHNTKVSNKIKTFIGERIKKLKRYMIESSSIDLIMNHTNVHYRPVLVVHDRGKTMTFTADNKNPYVALDEIFSKAKRWIVDLKQSRIHYHRKNSISELLNQD